MDIGLCAIVAHVGQVKNRNSNENHVRYWSITEKAASKAAMEFVADFKSDCSIHLFQKHADLFKQHIEWKVQFSKGLFMFVIIIFLYNPNNS